MSDIPDDQVEAMNRRALGTLLGFSNHKSADLVVLLRSGAPIAQSVRDELANAIETRSTAGVTLKIGGFQKQKNRLEGVQKRRDWLRLGEKVSLLLTGSGDIQSEFETISEALQKSESDCRKRYYYYKNYRSWSESFRSTGIDCSEISDATLQIAWHIASFDQDEEFKPVPPTGPGFDEMYRERTSFVRWLTNEGPVHWPEDLAEEYVIHILVLSDVACPDDPLKMPDLRFFPPV